MSVARVAAVPERVDVRAIERELHRLWASMDEQAADASPEGQAGGAAGAPCGDWAAGCAAGAVESRPAADQPLGRGLNDMVARREVGGHEPGRDAAGLDDPRADTATQVTRICTLTLVAVVRNGRLREVSEVAERLGARYPCRGIVLDLTPRPDERFEAEIVLHCHRSESPVRPRFCCEQITVTAAGRALSRVPALVLPLLMPDLPVYVWWPDDPPAVRPAADGVPPEAEAETLRRLAEVADALIVDSSMMRRPLLGLAAAAGFADPLSGGIRDFTWGRLTPWRDLIAQSFDPPPMRQALEHLEHVRIRTRPGTGSEPIAGLLLGGWLAGRLGWRPAGPARREGDVLRAVFWRDGGAVDLAISGGSGSIASFECAAGGPEPSTLSMTHEPAAEPTLGVEIRVGRGRPRTHAAGLPRSDTATLLAGELEVTGVDHVLRQSLGLVLRMMHGT